MRARCARLPASLAALLLLCACHAASAQARLSAHDVEAAYLMNFLRYTQWPAESFANAQAPYVIVVIGSGDVAASVRAVAQAAGKINGRAIEVHALHSARASHADRNADPVAAELNGAHLVYFDDSAAATARQDLPLLAGKPVLTVSDVPGFVAAGGMIELVSAAEHIVFAANPTAISAARLVVSAKVLKLARAGTEAPP